jgi:serine/threonine protein phosphatase PrpC
VESEAQSNIAAEPVTLLRIGEASSFGKNDWWSPEDWHKISPSGFAADISCDAGTTGELAIAAISLRGHKHRLDGLPNEDGFAVRVSRSHSGEEYAVLVLCDGLSSAKHSSYAARRVSSLVADMLCTAIADPSFIFEKLGQALNACLVETIAPELIRWPAPSKSYSLPAFGSPAVACEDVSPSDLLVTLTAAVVPTRNGEKGASEVFLATIGDSPAFILLKNGDWIRPSYGEMDDSVLTTATAAFPKTTEAAVTQIMLYEGDTLCLMSDGVGNFVQKASGTLRLGSYLSKVWRFPRDLTTLVRDVSFDLRSADDDRTVILCWTDREVTQPTPSEEIEPQ